MLNKRLIQTKIGFFHEKKGRHEFRVNGLSLGWDCKVSWQEM
jgi:hypothetical protein